MSQGSLLLRALHEHRDRRPNALIDEHHENLVLVAKENREAGAHRGNGADLHFKNGFTHIQISFSPSRPRSELLLSDDIKFPTKVRNPTQKSGGVAILGRFQSVLIQPISCVPAN